MNIKRIGSTIFKIILIVILILVVGLVTWYFIDSRDRGIHIDYKPPDVLPPDSSVLTNHNIKVVVHRGAAYLAPENTFASAAACIRLGVDYVEIDVRKSFDGVHYILHDETLDRTTNGRGSIFLHFSKYIDQLDAGSWFGEQFKGEPVPRLDTYLKWIKGKSKVYIHVKKANLNKVVHLIRDLDMIEETFFYINDDNMVRELNKLAPDFTNKMRTFSLDELKQAIDKFDTDMIECGLENLTPEMVSLCQQHGILIMTKGGDNTPEHYKKVINSPADLVNLDKPDVYLETVRQYLQSQKLKGL